MTRGRAGVDTGGTFTDVVSADGRTFKLPSRPDDPSLAVKRGLECVVGDAPVEVVHGTTVATNAVLEGKLAPVGVILNQGFKDILSIGRQARPDLYALEPRRPRLPTSAALQGEVRGRLGPGGVEIEALDVSQVLSVGRRLKRAGARSLAILFLHSYANRAQEQAATRALESLGLPVTASSDLNPEFREYERGITTVVNAGLRPLVSSYLARLEERLQDRSRVWVMNSEGGLMRPLEASREPARLLLSGPAAGLLAARVAARSAGMRGAVLSFDMGGTSTDVALIPGDLPLTPGLEVAGLPVRLPGLDIHTIGAGGGSIAHRDAGGALAVGPESAGADPGPAALGRGNKMTVTDAHLLLGHVSPRCFAGGEVALDPAAAEVCARKLARHLKLSYRDLLTGIIRLADMAMVRALRVISVERGHDPRRDALVSFGGAGGLHGVALARELGMRRLLVPKDAGVLSARGLLWAPPARTRSVTVLRSPLPGARERRQLFKPLVDQNVQGFVDAGFARKSLDLTLSLDLRYRGQSFELQVPDSGSVPEAFHEMHRARFGFEARDLPVELVALRCTVRVRRGPPRLERVAAPRRKAPTVAFRGKPVGLRGASLPVYLREELHEGDAIAGPALIAGSTDTTRLDARSRARVHRSGALVVEVQPC